MNYIQLLTRTCVHHSLYLQIIRDRALYKEMIDDITMQMTNFAPLDMNQVEAFVKEVCMYIYIYTYIHTYI